MKDIYFGLTGVKESGKTTAFEAIKTQFPGASEITLAKHLKTTCGKIMEIPRYYFDDQSLKEKQLEMPIYLSQDKIYKIFSEFGFNPNDIDFYKYVNPHIGYMINTPRQAAQYVGTEILRNFKDDIHCEAATKYMNLGDFYVITDMRFWNEFDYFNNQTTLAFCPIYIQNPLAESKLGPNPHASEKYVLEIANKCTQIHNDGYSLKTFQDSVINVVRRFLKENSHECA